MRGILWFALLECFRTRYIVSGTYSITKLRKSSSLLVVEKKQCFRETTFGWSIKRINCNSRFLYRLSCKTFFMATVSPVSKHFAWMKATSNSTNELNYENGVLGGQKKGLQIDFTVPEIRFRMTQYQQHALPCN